MDGEGLAAAVSYDCLDRYNQYVAFFSHITDIEICKHLPQRPRKHP